MANSLANIKIVTVITSVFALALTNSESDILKFDIQKLDQGH